MTQILREEVRGGAFDYGGEPPAPMAVRLRVVQFFDDGSTRDIWRNAALPDVFADWDAALLAQRDAAGQSAGVMAQQVTALEATVKAQVEQITALTKERDQARAQYEQLSNRSA